jgi:hypothetical protein
MNSAMRRRCRGMLALAGSALTTGAPQAAAQPPAAPVLVAFESERELATVLREAIGAAIRREPPPKPPCAAPAVRVDSTSRPQEDALVTGRVYPAALGTDAPGLEGTVVALSLREIGAATTSDGRFHLRVPAESLSVSRPVTATIRRIGYEQQRVALTLRRGLRVELNVPLCQATLHLEAAVATTATGQAPASVTNTQHAGVDEGGIVKRHGDHLVVLRRGRLFTIDVRGARPRPVAAIDAFGPGLDPDGAWYDEMLVAGDQVVVVGYSYARGGTEVGVFRIDSAGRLRHRATYHLRSGDYYSSRNYAARLVGTRLVFYAPIAVGRDTARPLAVLPAMRRWQPREGSSGGGAFRPITTAPRVFRLRARDTDTQRGSGSSAPELLHAVTTCDLASANLRCAASAVLAPEGRVFYVSPTSVYVATAASAPPAVSAPLPSVPPGGGTAGALLRLPLDGGAPSALRVQGTPIDQFSFLEQGGYLNVLLQPDGRGEGMWRAERGGRGALALLRLPLARFRDGTATAPRSAYRVLPAVEADAPVHNRFVGVHLLYGMGNGWGPPRAMHPSLVVVPLGGGTLARLPMPHGIDRIEALGPDALLVGSDTADLHFTGVRLARSVTLAQRYVLRDAAQGELRSHGFFYRPDDAAGRRGVLGLPVSSAGRDGAAHLTEGSASVAFVRTTPERFEPLGALTARPDDAIEDRCVASCVDWYGNARPLFVGRRVFALLGYELVEGEVRNGRIEEIGRTSFAPRSSGGAAR